MLKTLLTPALALRVVGLGAGVIANLAFISVGMHTLGAGQFGFVVITTNMAIAIQMLDFGITAGFINESGMRGDKGAPAVLPYAFVSLCIASFLTLVSASLLFLRAIRADQGWLDWQHLTSGSLVLCSGILASLLKLPLGILISAAQTGRYYAALLAQPVIVAVGTMSAYLGAGGLIELSVTFSAGIVAPGLVGFGLLVVSRWRAPRSGTRMGWRSTVGLLKKAGTLGVNQVATAAAFAMTPSLVGIAAGPTAASLYAVPHRAFSAAWSLIGVFYTANWAEMSRRHVDPSDQRTFADQLNRTGLYMAGALVLPMVAISPVLLEIARLRDSLAFYSVLSCFLIALLIRGSYLGSSLRFSANYPSKSWVVAELVGSVVVVMATLAVSGFSVLAGALALMIFAGIDRVIVRRGSLESRAVPDIRAGVTA